MANTVDTKQDLIYFLILLAEAVVIVTVPKRFSGMESSLRMSQLFQQVWSFRYSDKCLHFCSEGPDMIYREPPLCVRDPYYHLYQNLI